MQPDEARILGSRVDPVDMDEAQRRISDLLAQRRFAHVVTFGSEMAMLARHDRAYRDVINSADLVVPDTIGIVYAARMLGLPIRERVAGIELLERVCADCANQGIKVFLLGGADGVAQSAAAALQSRYATLQIVGTQHGYFSDADEPAILERIRSSGTRLVLVALGFPRQELWARRHAPALGPVVCIGVGGSLDVLSGRVRRAPRLLRSLGLEWLYRLVSEPQRLGRQLALPQFAMLVAGQALRQRLGRDR
jgi:N-acetylglucosaminyldiphosphoundecaprenol N-acetyl-beta-D-mannosaminyltransferase